MDARCFEVNVSVPSGSRFAGIIRVLAVHAARYAGCRTVDAEYFGAIVEAVAMACAAETYEGIRMIVRRQNGPIEVLVASERRFEPPDVDDRQMSIGWMTLHGRQMCRVRLAVGSRQ